MTSFFSTSYMMFPMWRSRCARQSFVRFRFLLSPLRVSMNRSRSPRRCHMKDRDSGFWMQYMYFSSLSCDAKLHIGIKRTQMIQRFERLACWPKSLDVSRFPEPFVEDRTGHDVLTIELQTTDMLSLVGIQFP